MSLSDEVREAVQYELAHSAEFLDEERRSLARRWLGMAPASAQCKPAWLESVSPLTRSVIGLLALPMIALLVEYTAFPDDKLSRDVDGSP